MDQYRNPIAIEVSDSDEIDSYSDNELCDSKLSETESDKSQSCEEEGSEQSDHDDTNAWSTSIRKPSMVSF